MSVFDTASKKIHNLLGMTTLGQKTMATSLGVAIASDQSYINVRTVNADSNDIVNRENQPGATVAVNTTPYSVGDAMHSDALSFALLLSAAGGTIGGVVITDKSKQKSALEVIIFGDEPTALVINNSAFDPSEADLYKCLGRIDIAAADYTDYVTGSIAYKACNLLVKGITAKYIYVVLVCRGTPTYTANTLGISLIAKAVP